MLKPFASRSNAPLPSGCEGLFAALLSDALDAAGCADRAMGPGIRPLDDGLRLWGRARTGLYAETAFVEPGTNPYALEIALVDDLAPGDVAVLAVGGSSRIAPWGSLLSTATRARGAAGCVTDGFVRDILGIRAMGLPVFAGGVAPLDSKGRGQIVATDVPVLCGGVRVEPGDLVLGDADGVVVVPQAREAEVLDLAMAKLMGERDSLRELQGGAYLRDVFARYGVL
jgi:regulator of RNase E activity RraA